MLTTVALLLLGLLGCTGAEAVVKCVKKGDSGWVDTSSSDKDFLACGRYIEDGSEGDKIGAGQLWVKTNTVVTNIDDAAEAAGYVEGYLTYNKIKSHFYNTALTFDVPDVPTPEDQEEQWGDFVEYIKKQEQYMKTMVRLNQNDIFWKMVSAQYHQVYGLAEGYGDRFYELQEVGSTAVPRYGRLSFLIQNSLGDYEDFSMLYSEEELTDSFLKEYWDTHLHCTGAIFPGGEGNDGPYMAHNSWNVYNTMTRIIKSYEFNYPGIEATHIVFSSYPGVVSSFDDFYITSKDLVVLETTVSTFATTLYDRFVKYATLPTWVRVMTANRLAADGQKWARTFRKFNSGTYNNQWIVLDYKKAAIKPYPKNTVVVLEMAPGNALTYDATYELKTDTFVPGINTPRSPLLFDYLGYPYRQYDKTYGYFGYQTSSRYILFQKYADKILTKDNFYDFMRYNNYMGEKDITHEDPGSSILSRYDQRPPDSTKLGHTQSPFGGLDTKYVTASMVTGRVLSMTPSPHNNIHDGKYDSEQIPNWTFDDLDCSGYKLFSDYASCRHEGLEGEITYGEVQFNGNVNF